MSYRAALAPSAAPARRRWRAAVLGLGLAAFGATFAEPAPPATGFSQRLPLLGEAEAALARGDAEQARRLLDRAAAREHASDIELGLVRCSMQVGDYRNALTFASHVAGAHGDDPRGRVLYAWLLSLSGQRAFARQELETAEKRRPGDPLVAEARTRLAASQPVPSAALLGEPHRVAPYATGAEVPGGASVAASGLLIDDGRRALAPAAAIAAERRLWLRNGLGQTVEARVERPAGPSGLAVLTLLAPLPSSTLALAARDGFAGSPAYAIEYLRDTPAAPAWPWLHQGFLGMPQADTGLARLGIELPDAGGGGPVFDLAGRLVGITLRPSEGPALLVPASRLREQFSPWLSDTKAAPAAPPGRLPADEIYELGLRVTLQLIQAPVPRAANLSP